MVILLEKSLSAASTVGSTHEKPNDRVGRSRETHGRWSRTGPVLCRRRKRNVNGAPFLKFGLLVSVEFNFVFDVRIFFTVRDAPTVAAFTISPVKDGLQQYDFDVMRV